MRAVDHSLLSKLTHIRFVVPNFLNILPRRKLNAARMNSANPKDGSNYAIHLTDTPRHVNFTFEVSRSREACQGSLLVVDASQGVEAQTLANVYLALEANLKLIPVLNKIELPGAEPDRVSQEIE